MRLTLSVIGALIGAALLPVSATAAPLAAMPKNLMSQPGYSSLLAENSLVTPVQYRHRPYRGRSYHRGGGNDGAGVAAGILGGLLLGAIIANQAQQNRTVEYCVQRFRSYDPYSRTYLGYDGRRHSCP
jgi:hypothetical protein